MPKRLISLALLSVLALPSQAGLFDDDEARKQIADIRDRHEKMLVELQEQHKELDSRSSQRLVVLNGEISGLKQQIAELRGQLEVANFNLQTLQKRQQDLYVDLETRLKALEEGRQTGANPLAQAQNAQLEAEAAGAYEAAYNLYRDGKLKPAMTALSDVATRYAATQAAPNALFWLGMAQAKSGDSKAAQLSFRKLVDAYRQHDKAPDALRAMATLQLGAGDKKAASKTFKELVAGYPGTEAAKEAEKELKKL
jgi:tol-pal system protein YbgF